MKTFNTILGAAGLAALAAAFAAQAQEMILPEPLIVTPDCAEKALKQAFEEPLDIVRSPEGVAGSRTTQTPGGRENHVSGFVQLAPTGQVEKLNVQVDLTDPGKTPLSVSATLDYRDLTTRINPPIANNLLSMAAVDYAQDLETALRDCVTLTPRPSQP